jgi:hypothetical protein
MHVCVANAHQSCADYAAADVHMSILCNVSTVMHMHHTVHVFAIRHC